MPSAALPDAGSDAERCRRARARRGVTLALENEHECNVATSAEARAALDAAASPHLRLIWDPGNAAMLDPSRSPGLGGLEDDLGPRRARARQGRDRVAGAGRGSATGSSTSRRCCATSHETGYDGYLSFETHYQRDGSGELATRDCVAALRELGA